MVCTLSVFYLSTVVSASQITSLIDKGVSTPITKTILHLQPGLSWKEANKHAWDIYKHAERTGVDWKLIVSITFQESSFRWFRGDKACGLDASGKENCVWRVFGPMHVYYSIWKDKLNLDPYLMLSSNEYGYRAGTDILALHKKRHGKRDTQWYARFNSNTRAFKRVYAARIDVIKIRVDQFLLYEIQKVQNE